METRAHHILIGLFTVLVAAAAITFALWLGKVRSDRSYEVYDIAFAEAVGGLSKGSVVEFNGIRIGEVGSLRLDPQDPRRVLARVRVDSEAPVRTDTQARLVAIGVTGLSKIRLSSGQNPASQPLRSATEEGQVPLIVAEPSALSKLMGGGDDLLVGLNELIAQTRLLMSAENVANVSRTLRHLEQTTAAVAAQREEMAEALRQLTQASRQANTALIETTRTMSSANRLLDEQGRQTLENTQRSMAAFEQAMRSVDRLLAGNQGALDGGIQGMAELGPALKELRGTLASLRQLSQRLEDNPAGFALGQERIREFQP